MTKLIPILKEILSNETTDENSQARLAKKIEEWLLGHESKIYRERQAGCGKEIDMEALVDIIKEELGSFSVSGIDLLKIHRIFITLSDSDINEHESLALCFIDRFIRGLVIANSDSTQEQEQTTTQNILFNTLYIGRLERLEIFIQFLTNDTTQESQQSIHAALNNCHRAYEKSCSLSTECQRYKEHLKKRKKTNLVAAKIKAVEELELVLEPNKNHKRFKEALDNQQVLLIKKHRNWRGRVLGLLTFDVISSYGSKFASNCFKILSLPSCHVRNRRSVALRRPIFEKRPSFFRKKQKETGLVAVSAVSRKLFSC